MRDKESEGQENGKGIRKRKEGRWRKGGERRKEKCEKMMRGMGNATKKWEEMSG